MFNFGSSFRDDACSSSVAAFLFLFLLTLFSLSIPVVLYFFDGVEWIIVIVSEYSNFCFCLLMDVDLSVPYCAVFLFFLSIV